MVINTYIINKILIVIKKLLELVISDELLKHKLYGL